MQIRDGSDNLYRKEDVGTPFFREDAELHLRIIYHKTAMLIWLLSFDRGFGYSSHSL